MRSYKTKQKLIINFLRTKTMFNAENISIRIFSFRSFCNIILSWVSNPRSDPRQLKVRNRHYIIIWCWGGVERGRLWVLITEPHINWRLAMWYIIYNRFVIPSSYVIIWSMRRHAQTLYIYLKRPECSLQRHIFEIKKKWLQGG